MKLNELNKRLEEVRELITFFSAMLIFGTFLIGISYFLIDVQFKNPNARTIGEFHLFWNLFWNCGWLITYGCFLGLIGAFAYILLYKYKKRDLYPMIFTIAGFSFIIFGVCYYFFYAIIIFFLNFFGDYWIIAALIFFVGVVIFLAVIGAIINYFSKSGESQ